MSEPLTPERRAELRNGAGEVGSWIDLEDLTALLGAADERDRLAAQVERVRALHTRSAFGYCRECGLNTPRPCPTLRALDGADDE